MIPKETIERVYSAAKIEEVVGDYVNLKRRGANMWGLCPFHNEKTPSFAVSPSKGIFKCFGCGKSGHSVGFIMEVEQCSYTEAIKQIAKKYHIEVQERELTAEEQQRQDDKESMYVVNDFANRWFQEQLWESAEGKAVGLSYFRERGLREETIRHFQLGYSPEKGNPLTTALKKQGFTERYIINDAETRIGTGISGKSEDGRLYDRFRDRVIFPIHSISGKTVGFAGRILKKKENVGKYVNSPESIIYSKTNELYGLYFSKQEIVRQDLCYLVEGQMDLISMYQSGIKNVVCSGGTALTKPQIRLIRRFTSNITVLYDGDAAGIHAALRGIDMFLEEGFNVKVVLLPDGEDPDSYARSHNASDFIEYIQKNETDFIRFKTRLLGQQAGSDPHKRSELIKDIVTSIAQIPDPITRSVYTKDCADQLRISEQLLNREVIRLRNDKRTETIEQQQRAEQQAHSQALAEEAAPTADTADDKSTTPVTQAAPMSRQQAKLMENFANLIQVIIRYGETPLYPRGDGSKYSAGEFIILQLQGDNISSPSALYQKVIDEFMAHKDEEGFKAETFFKFHSDVEISRLAVEMIADKYQLSRIFQKQSVSENITVQVKQQSTEEMLVELVPQLLLELKYTVINDRIDQLEQTLKKAQESGDWELMKELLAGQPQLLAIKNEIAKALGNRVITN